MFGWGAGIVGSIFSEKKGKFGSKSQQGTFEKLHAVQ